MVLNIVGRIIEFRGQDFCDRLYSTVMNWYACLLLNVNYIILYAIYLLRDGVCHQLMKISQYCSHFL